MGLVNRVVPDGELESYVKNYADMIAGNAPLTIKAVKAVVSEVMKDESKRDLKRAQDAVDACFKSRDYEEGRKAFMEKRKPVFTGLLTEAFTAAHPVLLYRLAARIGGCSVASVELRGLTKKYGPLAVVDNVSMMIEHGTLVCLLGPSGCGKTTTLRLIAGFVEPTEGEIRVGDRMVSSPQRTLPPERRNMSMIFQSYALWPHMTVAENIIYGLKLRKVDSATIKRSSTPSSPPRGLRRSPSAIRASFRRPAAARRAGARADRRARNAAARRAAVQPRRQPARGDALRGAPPARRVSATPRSMSPTTSPRR